MDPAQRELMLSQFALYKKNRIRIREIEDRQAAMAASPVSDKSERAALSIEHNQLSMANSRIFRDIYELLDKGE